MRRQVEARRLVGSTSGLSNDLVHLLNFSLSTAKGTEFLLSELAGTLLLGVTEQLDDTSLVGSKTSNLRDNVADESSLSRDSLLLVEASSRGSGGDLVALVDANGDSYKSKMLGFYSSNPIKQADPSSRSVNKIQRSNIHFKTTLQHKIVLHEC